MGRFQGTTGLREIINQKRSTFLAIAVLLLIGAACYMAYMQWPEPPPRGGDKAFYTVDDGQTWFVDSIYKTPPFKHDGSIAVRALVFSYHNGRQTFCPVVERYAAEKKKVLDDAIADAQHEGKPLSSIALFKEPALENGMEVKPSNSDHEWVSRSDRDESAKILGSIKAQDGSAVDSVIP